MQHILLQKLNNVDMQPIFNGNASEETTKQLESLKLSSKKWKYNNNEYVILRYDKGFLTHDMATTTGLFRSVICKNGNIKVFAPPKSIQKDLFMSKHRPETCYAEEFIEGTMINLFYDDETEEWELCTRSSVGGKIAFYKHDIRDSKKTFRQMFLECMNKSGLEFEMLNKQWCYSFVMQHPRNRIVTPILEPTLFLVKIYKITNRIGATSVCEIEMNEEYKINMKTLCNISFPLRFVFDSYEKLQEVWVSPSTDYRTVGVVVYHKDTGHRMKLRNPNYENVRKLRGNQPKIQYHYLNLRKEGKVKEYLKYYPESKEAFNEFRDMLHMFTRILFQYYVACYIKKTKPLKEYPGQYRTHMFKLHEKYLEELRDQKKYVNFGVVMEYVNSLHSSQQMFAINYYLRKSQRDEVVRDRLFGTPDEQNV